MTRVGGPNRVRAVLVGCGGISGAWLRAAANIAELEIAGLVDLREEAAHARAEEFGLAPAFIGTELGAALEAVSPDVVFNCTVPEAHLEVSLEALRRGCHVLSEKPLADSLESAARLVEAAREAGRVLAVTQNYRYNLQIRRLRHFVDSGSIGGITTVNADFYIGAHFGGFRDHMEHVLLVDMAIHTFDMARLLTGADPVSVYCREWNPAGSWYDRDASAVAVFQLTGGIVLTYRGSWCAEGLHTPWNGEWRIVGQRGSVRWDGAERIEAQVVRATGAFISEFEDIEVPPYSAETKIGGHEGILREFVACVQHGGEPETIASDNIRSLAMVFGAIQSAEAGALVEISW